jgi:hypothetical protein
MRTRHLQIETETRNGKNVYFSYVGGKYFEHPTREEVLQHLLAAAETAEKYADSYAKLKTDPEFQFLWKVIFRGLEDLNSGFDSPSLPMLDVYGGRHARRLVKSYSNRPGISFSGCFDVGENVPDREKRDRSRDLIDLEEALGGKRAQDDGDGPGS